MADNNPPGKLTVQDLYDRGLFTALAELLRTQLDAAAFLRLSLRFPVLQMPTTDNFQTFLQQACERVENGAVPGGLERLLEVAADVYPYDTRLDDYRRAESRPDRRGARPAGAQQAGAAGANAPGGFGTVTVLVEGCTDVDAVDAAARAAAPQAHFVYADNGSVALSVPDLDAASAVVVRLRRDLDGRIGRVSVPSFRDYLLRALNVLGPDGRHFAFDNVPASTLVGDVARAVIEEHYEAEAAAALVPRDRQGRRQVAVDLVPVPRPSSGNASGAPSRPRVEATEQGSRTGRSAIFGQIGASSAPTLAQSPEDHDPPGPLFGFASGAPALPSAAPPSLQPQPSTRRLREDRTLHEEGVEDGATLDLHPSPSAGAP